MINLIDAAANFEKHMKGLNEMLAAEKIRIFNFMMSNHSFVEWLKFFNK